MSRKGLGEDAAPAVRALRHVEGHKGAAGFHDGQHADDGPGRPLEGEGHHGPLPDAEAHELMGQACCMAVELGVGQLAVPGRDGPCVRTLRGARPDDVMGTAINSRRE